MENKIHTVILNATSAKDLFEAEVIQNLWSGYGKIRRYGLIGGSHTTVVVKHVIFPNENKHPRGWNTDFSHERKVKSYHVESHWYRKWSQYCDDTCMVPVCFHVADNTSEMLMVLEDLDAKGFPARKTEATLEEMNACLFWLANFHATFMQRREAFNKQTHELWQHGSYWHLDTRPDELAALDDISVKNAAPLIDQALQASPYQTFIHGDAKLANFCFSEDGKKVAAVDFQYIGGGCGMKDVALFISSCLDGDACERLEKALLDYYFDALRQALKKRNSTLDVDALEVNWRGLYAFAWADFYRFLKGWCPDHWKIHGYSEGLTREVIDRLHDAIDE